MKVRPFIIHGLNRDPEAVLKTYRVFKEAPESRGKDRPAASTDGFVEPKMNPQLLLSLLELSPHHSSACSVKANDIIRAGYQLGGDDSELAGEIIKETSPSFEVVLLRAMEDLQVFNYCALEVVRDEDGAPAYFSYVPAHTVRIHESRKKYYSTWDGVEKVYFKDYGADEEISYRTGEPTDDPEEMANELIFISIPSPYCSYYGVPRYVSAIPSILGISRVNNYNYLFFDNYTVPSYAITITGDFEDEIEVDGQGNPTGRTQLQALIEENFDYIARNPHTPIVLSVPGGDKVKVEFIPLSRDAHDSSFREYEANKKLDIAAAHMMDPYRIGIFEVGPLGGNLAEATARNYYESVIKPQRKLVETILTDFFQLRLGEEGVRADIIFDLKDELLLESDGIRNLALLIQNGVLTPGEVRRYLFNKDDGIDTLLLPGNLLPQTGVGGESIMKRAYKGDGIKVGDPTKPTKIKEDLLRLFQPYNKRLRGIVRNPQDVNVKKRMVDETLNQFKMKAYGYAEGLLNDAVSSAIEEAVKEGTGTVPLQHERMDRYRDLIHATIDDMVSRLQYYYYKVIGWRSS